MNDIVSFRLLLSSDGSVHEISDIESRVARKFMGDFKLDPGGMIVMSTDVNANAQGNWKSRAKGLIQTWYNRINRVKLVDRGVQEQLRSKGMESGWSIGNLYRGRYYSPKSDQTFNEKSFSIDIRGVPMDFVRDTAKKLGKLFNQESVLVVDHKNGSTSILNT